MVLDEEANAAGGPVISAASSDVTVLVMPTNEELEMARQAAALVALGERQPIREARFDLAAGGMIVGRARSSYCRFRA